MPRPDRCFSDSEPYGGFRHSSAEIASLAEEARAWSDDGESALPALQRLIDQRPEDRSLRKRYAECLLETEKFRTR